MISYLCLLIKSVIDLDEPAVYSLQVISFIYGLCNVIIYLSDLERRYKSNEEIKDLFLVASEDHKHTHD